MRNRRIAEVAPRLLIADDFDDCVSIIADLRMMGSIVVHGKSMLRVQWVRKFFEWSFFGQCSNKLQEILGKILQHAIDLLEGGCAENEK